MKVVLFCGGLGMRMRAGPESLPKPMMPIGSRPVLWHVMRYYAHFGHNDFILCLGYGAHSVKDYFLNYQETGSNDFVLSDGGATVELLETDISNWTITFVDTGIDTAIGERLQRVRQHLGDDPVFLANYGDVLTDAPINDIIVEFEGTDAVASLLAVKPQDSFHVVDIGVNNRVTGLVAVADMNMRINGGYFVLRQGIFDYLEEGDDLVMDGCVRAAKAGRLRATCYDGFWAPMDTLKERTALEDLHRRGISPWALWRKHPVRPGRRIIPVEVPDAVPEGPW
jgi:glucose-1-phosphate cytidylyltransferase